MKSIPGHQQLQTILLHVLVVLAGINDDECSVSPQVHSLPQARSGDIHTATWLYCSAPQVIHLMRYECSEVGYDTYKLPTIDPFKHFLIVLQMKNNLVKSIMIRFQPFIHIIMINIHHNLLHFEESVTKLHGRKITHKWQYMF